MKPDYDRRRTAHAPMRVVQRGRVRLMHGEPLCRAPAFPGSTVAAVEDVTCSACKAELERWSGVS